jgi:hypothetical protein
MSASLKSGRFGSAVLLMSALGATPGGAAAGEGAKVPEAPKGWPGGVRAAGRAAPDDAEDLHTSAAWENLLTQLRRAGDLVLADGAPATPIDRSEGWRHLGSLLKSGLSEMLDDRDADRPRFYWADFSGKWGLDCADALYASAPVRAGNVYRVRGKRGSVHFLGVQLVAHMGGLDDLDVDTLEIEPDGTFELTLGGSEIEGNWMALPEGATTLHVRQFFYDWDSEQPAHLTIERIDDGELREPPRVAPGGIPRQLEALGRFVHDNTEWWARIAQEKRALKNSFPDDAGGLGSVGSGSQKYQSFGIGYFDLAEDEALVVEVKPPKAKYWSLHLGNYWMESLDFANHQSSLNGHQAVLDTDGVFRAVVSKHDPGVPNWLDTAGRDEGSMIYRWNQADGAPIPAARVVKLSDLRRVLPPETGTVTLEHRAATIERRRAHVRKRLIRPL